MVEPEVPGTWPLFVFLIGVAANEKPTLQSMYFSGRLEQAFAVESAGFDPQTLKARSYSPLVFGT